MESNELLEQEEAFHKLNAEIELRTRQLMKNVEAVINKQTSKHWNSDYQEESCSKNYSNLQCGGTASYSINGSPSNGMYDDTDKKIWWRNNITVLNKTNSCNGMEIRNKEKRENGLIPQGAKGMSAESLVRFLKAKGKLIQEELEQVKRELQIKTEDLKKTHQEIKTKDDEKQKLLSDILSLRDKLKKNETNSVSVIEKLQMRDSENLVLKKEIELLKQDVKRLQLGSTGHEAKLNKAKEEIDKLKLLLKQSESNEKEAREKCRIKNEEMVARIRRLEKQKSDLIAAIKKQVILIENIRKQKILLETKKGMNYNEKEFLKAMEQHIDEKKLREIRQN